ncbi:MAG: hypothetical protein WC707_02785 [Candidatus Babeliaceae bacterium]|jgi:hypothetical protein
MKKLLPIILTSLCLYTHIDSYNLHDKQAFDYLIKRPTYFSKAKIEIPVDLSFDSLKTWIAKN